MTDQAPDLRAQLFAAQDWFAELVESTTDEDLSRATPCDGFDVRMLLTHVSTVFDKVVGFGTDHRDPYFGEDDLDEAVRDERLARSRIDAHTAAERAEGFRGSVGAARDAWTDDVLDTPIQLGWGPILPGRVVTAIYLMEILSHGWDLATATGQDTEAPGGLGEVGLVAAQIGLPAEPRGVEVGVPFGPVVESAPDAGPTERMANWTGRVSR